MERLVTTSEAAQILGLSLQGIHYRIKKEQLKSIKKDGKTFVYVDNEQKHDETPTKTKAEPIRQTIHDNSQAIIDVKNEQIELLQKSMKWMKKQYISEIFRLEKNQKRIIEVFNSEIKLLQSAFNEMRSIYRPQIQQEIKTKTEKQRNDFIMVKDFFRVRCSERYFVKYVSPYFLSTISYQILFVISVSFNMLPNGLVLCEVFRNGIKPSFS